MEWMMQERVDLARSQGLTRWPGQLMHPGDALAHRWVVSVYRDGEPVDLTGWAVTAYMTRQDGACVPVPGAADGCVAGVVLLAACYDCPGTLTGTLQASKGDVRITLARGVWQVGQRHGDQVIDPDAVVPSLPELLAQISAMEAATVACTEATAAAEAAIGEAAPPIVEEASGEVAVCSDAAARPAVAVVTAITAVQEGEGVPSADNVRPIAGRDEVCLFHNAAPSEGLTPTFTASLTESICGGTLDWTTGTLTITHRLVTLGSKGASETGRGAGAWNTGSNNFFLDIVDRSANTTLQSNRFVTSSRVATQMYAGQMCLSATYPRVVFANPGNALSLEEWKAQCEEAPIQLLYELATPRTIQLTPRTLTLLAGRNALWSDACGTSLAYIVDTKTYTDNALAAIAAAVIAQ